MIVKWELLENVGFRGKERTRKSEGPSRDVGGRRGQEMAMKGRREGGEDPPVSHATMGMSRFRAVSYTVNVN